MSYIFDEKKNIERQRLFGLTYERLTIQLMDAANLGLGVRCLDLGCGIGESTRLLAERSGVHGEVVGIDTNAELLEIAKKMPAVGAATSYETADARRLPFDDRSFDFVLARSLLQHLSDPEVVISEMVRVCRPGGGVAVTDADLSKHYCFPDNSAVSRMTILWAGMIANPVMGPKLWPLFNSIGYSSINVSIDLLRFRHESAALKRLYLLSLESTRTLLVERGLVDDAEADRLLAECRRLELDHDALCLGPLIYTVWVVRR